MDQQLLAIHTQRPPLPPGLVRRARLVEAVEQALAESKVVLVSAPAGSGKTSLLVEWAHQTARPVAWLTIEEDQSDPIRFLRYLVMAWSAADPALLDSPAGVLLGSVRPDLDLASRALANHAALAGKPIAFVLDDLHLLRDPESLRLLTFLIDHQPLSFRFLLGSRGQPDLPLARFRVRHRLVQLGADRLAFTLDESQEMLGAQLDRDEIARAHERTEGWAAGLRLLAQPGDHANAAAAPAVEAYLQEEVLSGLDPDSREKLLALGIVDRLTPELGDAILETPGTAALLDRLAREQLFIQPLSTGGGWYRIHPLLLDAVRAGQSERDLAPLHTRAAGWFLAHDMIDDALRHAVAAGDLGLAVEITEPRVVMTLVGGDFHRVHGWIDLIPETWYLAQPELNFLRIAILIFAGEFERSLQLIDTSETRLLDQPGAHTRTLAKFEAARCAVACFQDKLPAAEFHAARAFDGLDAADVTLQCNVHHVLADTYRRHGRWDDALRHYDEILALAPQDPASRLRLVHAHGGAMADLELRRGALRAAAAHWRTAIAEMRRQENWGRVPIPLTGWAYIRHGELLYEWNDLAEAETALALGLERAELGGDARAMIAGNLLAARLYLAHGRRDQAMSALHRAEQLSERAAFPEWISQIDRVRALLLVATHDSAGARAWRRDAESPMGLGARVDTHDAWLGLAHLLVVFGGLAEHERARDILAGLLAEAERDGMRMIAVEALALLALVDDAEGAPHAALDRLGQALVLAESEEPVRRLIDLGPGFHDLLRRAADAGASSPYGRLLLDACPNGPISDAGPAGALSDRELEILRLVGAGMTNREVAERLFISAETVKRHLANIYDKLDVHRRTEALLRARELGILA